MRCADFLLFFAGQPKVGCSMEDFAAFIGFLLLTGSLFFVAKFVLEKDEFRYVRKMSLFFALPGALLFWGAGRLDPALSAVSKFLVSGALILVLILVTQAFAAKEKTPPGRAGAGADRRGPDGSLAPAPALAFLRLVSVNFLYAPAHGISVRIPSG